MPGFSLPFVDSQALRDEDDSGNNDNTRVPLRYSTTLAVDDIDVITNAESSEVGVFGPLAE